MDQGWFSRLISSSLRKEHLHLDPVHLLPQLHVVQGRLQAVLQAFLWDPKYTGVRWWTVMDGDGRWWMVMDGDGRWWMVMDGDGWWWMVMDGDGRWWTVMDGDGRWWTVMDGDGRWWMVMDGDGWWWMVMDGDGWWWTVMDGDGRWWMVMDGDGWWWMVMDGDGWWWMMWQTSLFHGCMPYSIQFDSSICIEILAKSLCSRPFAATTSRFSWGLPAFWCLTAVGPQWCISRWLLR